ncbi:hypothetical protein FHK02_3883 [Spirosoma sp. LMG 31448]|uniref:Uncharacterized protein n=1 Tax=Spirosoma utsteinense TaxID=2585773 RepID=A0ABR6W993_9BACT|nr:hypothetical protein [Spirosoma utsteinense]MBC3793082.1 hypothetical protein [Spirosoma utsteinense]
MYNILISNGMSVNILDNHSSGAVLGIWLSITDKQEYPMLTFLLLSVSALLCFAVFYKVIDWFEHI